MEDPSGPARGSAHRYLLESDSEDDEEQGYLSSKDGPSKPKIRIESQPFVLRHVNPNQQYDQVVIGVGQAGGYLERKLGVKQSGLTVLQGANSVGRGFEIGSTLLLSVNEVDNEDVWSLARTLQEGLQASSWIAVTTYLPAMYIPQSGSPLPKIPPIRHISTQQSNLPSQIAKFESPNYINGLPAALASLAIHPSSPEVPTTILSLPLPLSSIPTADLSLALTALVPELKDALEGREGKASRWEENDDEPFEAPGMGARGKAPKGLSKEDVGSMYM